MTLDLIILLCLALLGLRGWFRGFVREAMDLVGLVVGILLAFRFGPSVGRVIEAMAGLSPDAGRLAGGIVVFVLVGVGTAVVTRIVERKVALPGLNLMNKVGGAGLGLAWGVFLATLLLTLGVILPMPPSVAETLDGSAVSRALTDPDGVAQETFRGLAGDRVVEALVNLRDVFGERRVVIEGDERIELPPADADDLEPAAGAAVEVFELLNRARVDAGLDPLAWSAALADVGAAHAEEMYRAGFFSHLSPVTGTVGDRLAAAGIAFSTAGENLALAASPGEVHGGLMESPGHRANILSDSYRRVGIGVVRGPLGLMTVQVFTG